ncbi:MAG: efflux RND transporter periplasmic adaptor subunit [Acidobacteriota bacterium]|nr:MAG: efflux RND transporter periplasmic adaptor subunit [Acidobacteriota bacterium]
MLLARPSPFVPALVALLVSTTAGVVLVGCHGAADGAPSGATAEQQTRPNKPAKDAIAVRVTSAERRAVSSIYATSATLRADKRATVIARTQGVIEKLLVEEGDLVQAGQPLAELEDDEQQINAEIARTTRETTAREFERAQRLKQQGLMSDEEFEAKRRLAEEAEQSAQLAELELERTVIDAPFSGRILVRHLDVGATVSNGTAVYDLADLQPLYADVTVPERHVERISPGQRVRITAETIEDHLDARIERIGHLVDPQTGTVKVTVAVPGAGPLRPGSFVRVGMITDTHHDALVVARSALVAEGRRWHLFRLAEGGDEVEMLEVRLGYEEGDIVEVLETLVDALPDVGDGDGDGTQTPLASAQLRPLMEGEQVVVVGASALSDGAPVRVIDAEGGEVERPEDQAAADGEDGGAV